MLSDFSVSIFSNPEMTECLQAGTAAIKIPLCIYAMNVWQPHLCVYAKITFPKLQSQSKYPKDEMFSLAFVFK